MKKLDRLPLRRALISVYDKTNLAEFARGLHEAGVKLVSTGSTASTIAAAGVPVTEVTEITEFPECLEGRVKTLHPRIHAGILADRRKQEHIDTLNELDVEPFDLVVVNLYPFAETVASGADQDAIIENLTAKSIYEVPLMLEEGNLGKKICELFNIPNSEPDLQSWKEMVESYYHPEKEVTVALVGKQSRRFADRQQHQRNNHNRYDADARNRA